MEVKGLVFRDTDCGELQFPDLEGWPNQGVGRINPDWSKGACTSCHPPHDFSVTTARKPVTCSECHKGPDAPAYKVCEISKHGNTVKSEEKEYDFTAVPWIVGKDFTAPTCVTCHASLLVSPDKTVIAECTNKHNDRLSWRLVGVPCAHPHPIKADLHGVVNFLGLPIAVELTSEPVARFLINEEERQARNDGMKTVCRSCHSTPWVGSHFERLENTIETSIRQTVEAAKIMLDIWKGDYEQGLPHLTHLRLPNSILSNY
jgi:hypothetical protein